MFSLSRLWNTASTLSNPHQADRSSSVRTDIASSHVYHTINISGNASATLGNVYGSGRFDTSSTSLPTDDGTHRPVNNNANADVLLEASDNMSTAVLIYEKCHEVISLINHPRSGPVDEDQHMLIKRLTTWCLISQDTLRGLLDSFQGSENTRQMLADALHPTWSSGTFRAYLEARFGFHLYTLELTLKSIYSSLSTLCRNWPSTENSLSIQAITTELRLRPDPYPLARTFESLKQNVTHFRGLTQECPPLRTEATASTQPSAIAKSKIGQYSRVQTIAANLYQAFALACSKHLRHEVHLMLRAASDDPTQVLFKLVLPINGAHLSRKRQLPLSLTVESRYSSTTVPVDRHTEPIDTATSLVVCRKRGREHNPNQALNIETNAPKSEQNVPQKRSSISATAKGRRGDDKPNAKLHKSEKVVSFAMDAKMPDPTNNIHPDDTLQNFCTKRNFCSHVESIDTLGIDRYHALGYLASKGCTKHMLYMDRPSNPEDSPDLPSKGNPTTLRSLCSDAKLTQSKIASISKQLAIAVLQFHATPWLESWDGDHILVTDLKRREQKEIEFCPSNTSPAAIESYVNVSINRAQDASSLTPISSRSKTLIPNWTLLKLGIMMLELAYQQPLRQMQEPDDLYYPNEHDTDFYTARRLSREVSSKMGLKFQQVVERCVSCDFGHGHDLSATELQASYYQTVIQELDGIETKLKGLGL